MISGHARELLKMVSTIISLHFPQTRGTYQFFQNRSINHGHYQNLDQNKIPDQNKITAPVSFVGLLLKLLVTAITKIGLLGGVIEKRKHKNLSTFFQNI